MVCSAALHCVGVYCDYGRGPPPAAAMVSLKVVVWSLSRVASAKACCTVPCHWVGGHTHEAVLFFCMHRPRGRIVWSLAGGGANRIDPGRWACVLGEIV